MKVHLCCGDIYLDGYKNIDISGSRRGEVIVGRSLKNYYLERFIGSKQPTVIDQKMDLTKFPWPFKDNSIQEFVMIQGIEHFYKKDAFHIVQEIQRKLKKGGRFLVDFPDIKKTVETYIESDPEFAMRFIYCNHKNQYSVHHWGYTRETFRELLGSGWKIRFRTIVKHDYPVIGCEATKL